MAGYTFSEVLFVNENGLPMRFSMRPCEEKSKLKSIIEFGGGVLTSKSSVDRDSIRLVDPGSKVFSSNCISSKFVWDCVAANELLKIDDYRVPRSSDLEDKDKSDVSICSTKIYVSERETKSRKEYLYDDDMEIINFIIDTKRYAEVKGTVLWKDMERLKIIPDRSYQSLRERFIKTVLPRIHTYNILESDIRKFKQPISNEDGYSSGDASSEASSAFDKPQNKGHKKAVNYSENEDLDILESILHDSERIYNIHGNAVWKTLEKEQVTDHSWQSMRDRFLKRILPNLSRYSVSEELKANLEILIAYYLKKNRGKLLATNSEMSNSRSEGLKRSKDCNRKKKIIPLEFSEEVNSENEISNNRAANDTKRSKRSNNAIVTVEINDSDSSDKLKDSSKQRKIINNNNRKKSLSDIADIIITDSDKEDSSSDIVPDSTDITPLKRKRVDDEESVDFEFQKFDLNFLPAFSENRISLNGFSEKRIISHSAVAKSENSPTESNSNYETAQSTLSNSDKNSHISADNLISIQSPDLIKQLKSHLKLVLNQPQETLKNLRKVSSLQAKHRSNKKADLESTPDSTCCKEGTSSKIQEIIDELNSDWSYDEDSEISFKVVDHLKKNGRVPELEENVKKSNKRGKKHEVLQNHTQENCEDSEETDVEQDSNHTPDKRKVIKQGPVSVRVTLKTNQSSEKSKEPDSKTEEVSSLSAKLRHVSKDIHRTNSESNSSSSNISSQELLSDVNSDILERSYSLRSHKRESKRELRSAKKIKINLPLNGKPKDTRQYKKTSPRSPQKSKYFTSEASNSKRNLEPEQNFKSLTLQSRIRNDCVNSETDSENNLQITRKPRQLETMQNGASELESEIAISNKSKKLITKKTDSETPVKKSTILQEVQNDLEKCCVYKKKLSSHSSQDDALDNSMEDHISDKDSISSADTEIYISNEEDFSYSPQKQDNLQYIQRLKELAVEDFTEDDDLIILKVLLGILGCSTSDLINILRSGRYFIDESLQNLVANK